MIITIKNIHQQTFTVDIDGSRKVSDLKKLLANNIPEYPAHKQYIIYAGRIMGDDDVLGSYAFDSSRFLVVMNREPIQHQMGSTSLPVPKAAVTNVGEGVGTGEEDVPVRDEESSARTSEASASSSSERDYIITGTEKYIEVCKSLIDMGYEEKNVELAMQKAFNNPERAVEYLLHGPLQQQPSPQQEEQQPRQEQPIEKPPSVPMQTNEQSVSPKPIPGPLDFLKSQHQFLQMRRVVRENPHLLSAVLKKIEETNPSLLKLITDNKDEFLRIMNEENNVSTNSPHVAPMPSSPPTQSQSPPATVMQSQPQPQPQQPQPQPTAASSPPTQSARTTITVTTQEKEAIERLKALGFTEHMVLQAYFACDKNEFQAADFLLSQDDDVEQ